MNAATASRRPPAPAARARLRRTALTALALLGAADAARADRSARDDGDGIAAEIEDGAPHRGDGNRDGVADRLQPGVVSFPDARTGAYLTLVAPPGGRLTDVRTDAPADPGGFVLPYGGFGFRLHGRGPVLVILPAEAAPTHHHGRRSPSGEERAGGWYELDAAAGTSAVTRGNRILLHVRDGSAGDADAARGVVLTDLIGPAERDGDHDGLGDVAELRRHATDPARADSDDDGIGDGEELARGTSPREADSDRDGLADGVEVAAGSDPRRGDSDRDDRPDGADFDVVRRALASLPTEAFAAAAAGRLGAALDTAEAHVRSGHTAEAERTLESVRGRLGRCSDAACGGPPGASPALCPPVPPPGCVAGREDWIVECQAQRLVRSIVEVLARNVAGAALAASPTPSPSAPLASPASGPTTLRN